MGNWFNPIGSVQMNLYEDYINEIIEDLPTVTNGKVKGAFKEIKYEKAGYNSAIAILQEQFEKNNRLFENFLHRPEDDEDKIVEKSDEITKKEI